VRTFSSQGKSDKILETVLRMDSLLRSIHENLVWASLGHCLVPLSKTDSSIERSTPFQVYVYIPISL
jgi:hypothetical protein